jgi:hypothetical protein
MNTPIELKLAILKELHTIVDNKIEVAKKAIVSAKEARDSDTKSSAGDKYETTREMMQIEIDKSEVQLSNAIHLKAELNRIIVPKVYIKVEHGALIYTTQGNYFLSIGLGKLVISDEIIYAISIASPIGSILQNKKAGDSVLFQGKEIIITTIL